MNPVPPCFSTSVIAMTFSELMRKSLALASQTALMTVLTPLAGHAALGDAEGVIDGDRLLMKAGRHVEHRYPYRVHVLKSPDGSHVRQYVGADNRVFAVTWHTLYKPDLNVLLGSSGEDYVRAVANSTKNSGFNGIQRNFHHQDLDLVVQSQAYLRKFSGFAYRRSLLPPGFRTAQLGGE